MRLLTQLRRQPSATVGGPARGATARGAGVPEHGRFIARTFTIIQVASGSTIGWASGFESAFYFYAASAMLAYMLADHDITTDERFGIGASFSASPR
jgi:hypothetical protein